MLAKFSVFSIVCAVFLMGTSAESNNEIENLENIIEQRLEKVKELNKKIENATVYYDEMAVERINSLNYIHEKISVELQKTNKDAVYNGLNKNKVYSKFECIVKEANNALKKMNTAHKSFPNSAKEYKEKSFLEIEPFLVIVKNVNTYISELLETKRKEISETTDINKKKKILKEVADILKFIDNVLAEVEKKVFKVKFSFFEKFVHLCYNTEQVYKKVQREDFKKISKCV